MRTPALDRALSRAGGLARHGHQAAGPEGDDDDHGSLLGELEACVSHALIAPPDTLGADMVPLATSLAAELGRRAAAQEPGRELTPADYLRLVVIPAADAGTIARVELSAWRRTLIERPSVEPDPRVAAFLAAANTRVPRPAKPRARARRSATLNRTSRSPSRPPRR